MKLNRLYERGGTFDYTESLRFLAMATECSSQTILELDWLCSDNKNFSEKPGYYTLLRNGYSCSYCNCLVYLIWLRPGNINIKRVYDAGVSFLIMDKKMERQPII